MQRHGSMDARVKPAHDELNCGVLEPAVDSASVYMHDIRFIREHPDAFDRGLSRRGLAPEAQRLIARDEERRKKSSSSKPPRPAATPRRRKSAKRKRKKTRSAR